MTEINLPHYGVLDIDSENSFNYFFFSKYQCKILN